MYIRRDLEDKIDKYINSPEIIAIFGPRQVGKTTLLKKYQKSLKNSIYLTFEDIELKILFEEDIKSFIKLYIKPYDYIFIDEFQYAKNGGKNLKFIYDSSEKKIFISGSSAMELSVNAIKYLAGRIFIFNLYSFSYGEFLRVKDENLYNLYKELDENISEIVAKKIYAYFDEYLSFGGYPRVVLAKDKEEKIEVLKNLMSIYLLRDIKDIAKISDENSIYTLLKTLSLQIGSVVSFNELSNFTQINAIKVKEYIDILEKAFLIKKVSPFFTNKRLEIVKNPKIFFLDLGLRNVLINNFNPLQDRVDSGEILENFVLRELIDKDIKYYRTKNGAEVDFIVDDKIPIEVKSRLSTFKISKSYHYFLENYKAKRGYLLNFNIFGKKEFKSSQIYFLPHFLIKNAIAKST